MDNTRDDSSGDRADQHEQEHEDTGSGGRDGDGSDTGDSSRMERVMYLRFAAMIVTGMVVMYWVMFAGTYEWSHVRYSQSRVYMTLTMGGTMGLVMLAWMLNMYRNVAANVAIVVVSLLLLVGGIALDRSQTGIGDVRFMQAMIPHHSLAITRSERFDVDDVRVCDLAVEISEAQRREILEMDWLIADIDEHGAASTRAEAADRPVPNFDVSADLSCPPD